MLRMTSTEFFNIVKIGHILAVEEALQASPNLLRIRDEQEMTPLHWAVEYSQTEIAQLLVSKGAEIDARNDEQDTPLFAALFNSLDIARLLIAADADIQAKNKFGRTPLHELAYYGRCEESQFLIGYGANIHSRDNGGYTPLHEAAVSGMAEAALLLIVNGAEVNCESNSGYTPLHLAVSTHIMQHQLSWHLTTIEVLIKHGANVNARTKESKTPLELAQYNLDYPEITELLIHYGAK